MAKKKSTKTGPSFARCNQCKLVFKDASDCATHAMLTGHNHTPKYHCTVCDATFERRSSRSDHIKSTKHVQAKPETYALPVAPASGGRNAGATTASASRVATLPVHPVASTGRAMASKPKPKAKSRAPRPAPGVMRCMACYKQFTDGTALIDVSATHTYA